MAKKKNSVEVKLIQGNTKISKSEKPDVNFVNELVEKSKEVEKVEKPALLISRIDYPVTVKYSEFTIRVSPRAKLKIANYDKLGELPKGLVLKKMPLPS